ncbi:extracellular solute-binding protein [Arthrobacter sp. UYEF20]|uniref:ABC transporter substrate-binding protein n=1 Tax=Arthrobacter sp. UYEF20 TaxID=1756363 RepID=UPI003392D505
MTLKNARQRPLEPRRMGSKIAAISLGAALLLTACTQGEGGGVPGALNVWYPLPTGGSSADGAATYKEFAIDPFTALHPEVKVNAVPNNVDTIDQKIQVALAAGGGPDLIPTPGTSNVVPFASAGYLADLSSTVDKSNLKSRLLPWALDMGYFNDKLVALPTSYESLVLYYNKTLFAQNGWKPPTDRASLETLAGEMQSKGITPFAAGNASYQPGTEWLVSAFLNEVAGPQKLHDALSGTIPWTDPAIASSIELLKEYFDKGYFGGGVKQYFTTQDPQKYAAFADGKAGMYISGSWEMFSLPEYFGANGNTNDWDWAPLPALAPGVPSDIFPLAVGGTISVNAKSKNIPAATSYIDWMFSDTKTMWAAAEANGSQPLPVKFTASDVPSGIDPRYSSQYLAINKASEEKKVGYVTWTSFGPKANTYIVEHIDKVLNSDLSVGDFTAGIEKEFSSDKSAGLVPPLFETGK